MELFHLLDISKSISVMEVGRQECPPGHAWSLYLLDRTVIHYVESGKGTYVCSGKTFHLKKGDAFYIPTHTRGRYRRTKPTRGATLGFISAAIPAINFMRIWDYQKQRPFTPAAIPSW